MITQDNIIEYLSQYEHAVRAEAGFAYAQLEHLAPRALKDNQRLARGYLQKSATRLYQSADTFARLHALSLALTFVYEQQADKHPQLMRPHQFLPTRHKTPVIAESSPSPGAASALNAALDDALHALKKRPHTQRALILTLALARQAGVFELKQLNALLEYLTDAMVLTDARRVLVHADTQIFVLDAPATAFARNLLKLRQGPWNSGDFASALKQFILAQHGRFPALQHLQTNRPHDILQSLCFYELPPVAFELTPAVAPLPPAALLRATTGQSVASSSSTHRPDKRRRSAHRLQHLQLSARDELDKTNAYDPRTGSVDESLLSDVRQALNRFAASEPRQSRASRAFKALEHQLIQLLDSSLDKTSWFAYTIALYCTDLAFSGTANKEKLRISTITTYLSRLKSFARQVWSDPELIQSCPVEGAAREALTELMNAQLNELDASELVSVMQYLSYVEQTLEPPWLSDEIEAHADGGAQPRAHYVSCFDFQQSCQHFLGVSYSAARQQFVLFVSLMFRLGLRYDEALSLQTDELRAELGYVVISKRKLRKTANACRKVRLSFMTTTERVALEKHLERRELAGESLLFHTAQLRVFEREFLQKLREQSEQPELVFHSLRHCAANNMLFQLALCCYPELLHLRSRYFFLQDEAFSDTQLSILKADMRAAGYAPGPEVSVMDMLCAQLGHSSPAVTALSYLHLLPILCAELNERFDKPLANNALLALLAHNNYQYEHKARYKALQSEPARAAQYIFRTFTRGWHNTYSLAAQKSDSHHSHQLRFSAFIEQCQRFLCSQRAHPDDCQKLQRYLVHNGSPALAFISDIEKRHIPAWLRLIERLDTVTANSRERNALHTFRKLHGGASSVRDFKQMRRCLRVFSIFGMQRLTLELQCNTEQPSQLAQLRAWRGRIEAERHTVLLVDTPGAETLCMTLRPRYARVPLWPCLADVISAFETYLHFIDQRDAL